MKTILLMIIGIILSASCTFLVSEADARCAGPYPCRASNSPLLSAEIAFRSDTIALGIPVNITFDTDAVTGYDKQNPENPCGLGLQYLKPNEGITDYLNNSKYKTPILYDFKVEQYYKNKIPSDSIRVIGLERITDRQYAQQFSHGYEFTPEIGEELLLYLRHFDEFTFGTNCVVSDVYLVDELQGSIWGWNEDDFIPDIYPGDVKITPLKQQEAYVNFDRDDTISPAIYDLISCPLGMEPMYRLYHGSPFCVTSDTADTIENRGWAKPFSFFWTFDGLSYKHTENYELWRK